MSNQTGTPIPDESLLVAISHVFGFLVALIVWATQKVKSSFVRFQSVQAIAFHLVVSLIMLFVVGLIMALVLGVLALGIGDIAILGSQGSPTPEPARIFVACLTTIPFLIPCLLILVAGIILVARLVATIQTFQGKNFNCPWLGRWVEYTLSK